MKSRVLILGAGFGGLELATSLAEAGAAELADITVIDQSDHFIFGFSKLDVMFGKQTESAIKLYYKDFVKPGVRVLRETITAIDPAAKRVTTNAGTHEADHLVIALGAIDDVSKTPGMVLGKNEFYTLDGANALREVIPTFKSGHAVIGVCHAPYKCPPAPSECALMLHDHLVKTGVRAACKITIVSPLATPVPPSPETSKALLAAFAEQGITFMAQRKVVAVEGETIRLDNGETLSCQLFLGVPRGRAPDVVVAAGVTDDDGWVTIDKRTLETKFPGVYALGDLANTGAPKAGIFAEAAAKTVSKNLLDILRGNHPTAKNPGAGACYIEFGGDRVARVDVDFYSGPAPTGTFHAPSVELRADKNAFGTTRKARWFGL